MSAISFTVPGLPIAKGRPRVTTAGGFARTYTPAKTEKYESWVRTCAVEAMAGLDLLAGPCVLNVAFLLPVPSSWPAWKREAALIGDVLPIGRPDLDNWVKCISDACNTVVFRDDSQIVQMAAAKLYASAPEARVVVTPSLHITSAAAWKEHKRRQAFVQEPGELFEAAE